MSTETELSGDDSMLSPKEADVNSTPALSDLSSRDKPWDKHRANADKVEKYYQSTKEFTQYSTRISFCSQLLDFKMTPDEQEGVMKLKLENARFCRVRHCPVCQWRRSLMWKAKAFKILPSVVEAYPKHRWLFLTLTVRNCKITELKQTLSWMNKSWQRLTQLKGFPSIGWIRSTEVTRGKDGSAHPHFHCLLLVPASYFGAGYLKQAQWVELWKQCLRIDYDPVLDVRALKKNVQPMSLVPELLKYCVKESDLVEDREWFLELTRQLANSRAISTGGVLKNYLKALEEEPEDLIGQAEEDETEEEDDGVKMRFGWKKKDKKYRLVD